MENFKNCLDVLMGNLLGPCLSNGWIQITSGGPTSTILWVFGCKTENLECKVFISYMQNDINVSMFLRDILNVHNVYCTFLYCSCMHHSEDLKKKKKDFTYVNS